MIEGIYSIFLLLRNYDDLWFQLQVIQELHTAHIRQFNIQEYDLNIIIVFQGIDGLHCSVVRMQMVKVIRLIDKLFNDPGGQLIILNDNAIHSNQVSQ